jgi:DNA processing protein
MLTLTNRELPERLQRLHQPPKQLFVKGELLPLLDRPCVGIVGSRKVSAYGRQVTERLARELAERGVVIVSGLALGVDSIAHQAALDAKGGTIAVLGGPVEDVSPASHRQLAKNIVEQGGAIVSEYPKGSMILRPNFVARNRIIAALSDVVLVTEAALKSGSLHTARFTIELGKDVLSVPGNITSVNSEGTNNLLRVGAQLVTSVDDILHALKLEPANQKLTRVGDTPAEQAILDLLQSGVSDGNELQQGSQLNIDIFNQTLTMLEINGKVRSLGANQWTL